jgi:hypothetical protein
MQFSGACLGSEKSIVARHHYSGENMKNFFIVSFVSVSQFAVSVYAEEKDTRGGNCEQTKSQYEYFCTKKGDPAKDDIMTSANIACGNAKRNMAAACDGQSEKDLTYVFDKDGKPLGK